MSDAIGEVSYWLSLVQMTPGRVILAMNQLEAKIEAEADRELLVPLIQQARDAAWAQLEVDANWLQNRGIQPTRPEAKKVDPPADRCVGGVFSGLTRGVEALAPVDAADEADEEAIEEAEIRADAQEILKDHFAQGAAGITALRYEDQLVQMKRLVATLKLPKYARLVEKLGFGLYVRRLERLLPRYEAALGQVGTRAVTFDQVTNARTTTHQRFAAVVGALLGPRDAHSRATLLAPVALQQRLMSEARAARRPVRDVDPTSGEEIDAPIIEENPA